MEQLLAKLGVNWQLLVAQCVNFFLLLFVLTKFVYRPFLQLLDARAERVRVAMENASNLEHQAQQMEAERQRQLRKIDEEAGAMLADVHKQVESMRQDLLQKAHMEAQRILENGRRQLRDEEVKALAALRTKAADMVVRLTETLLRREFSAHDQKRMLQEVSERLPSFFS